jgi:hypothetical protein
MFAMGPDALEIMAITALVYVAVLAGLRLAGKRELGQMTASISSSCSSSRTPCRTR